MTAAPVTGVLLDFDGVISSNATGLLFRATHAFINDRTPMTEASLLPLFKQITAFPMREALTTLLIGIGLDSEFPALAEELGSLREFDGDAVELAHGFADFHRDCTARGTPMVVCSTMDRATARRSLLDPYFTDEDFLTMRGKSKAAPATYVDGLVAAGFTDPSGWTLVDDSPWALRAAKLAGLTTIMMTNDVFTEADAASHGAVIGATADSFATVSALLGRAQGPLRAGRWVSA